MSYVLQFSVSRIDSPRIYTNRKLVTRLGRESFPGEKKKEGEGARLFAGLVIGVRNSENEANFGAPVEMDRRMISIERLRS